MVVQWAPSPRQIKVLLAVYFTLIGAIPTAARFDLLASTALIPYVGLLFALLILFILVSHTRPAIGVILGCLFVLSTIAAILGPVSAGQLHAHDQHISAHFVGEVLESGHLDAEQAGRRVRGWDKMANYPTMYAFLGVLAEFTGVAPVFVVRIFPAVILPILVLLGGSITDEWREFVALLWIVPVTFPFSTSTTVPQTFALVPFGLLLACILNWGDQRREVLLILAVVVLALSHSITPVVAMVVLTAVFFAYHISGRFDLRPSVAVYPLFLLAVWAWVNDKLLGALGHLVFGGPFTLLSYFRSPGQMPELYRPIPEPLHWWIGLGAKSFAIVGLAAFLAVLILGHRHLDDLLEENVVTFVAGGAAATMLFPLSNIRRTWLFGTLLASTFVATVYSRRSEITWSNVVTVYGIAAAGALLLLTFRFGRKSQILVPNLVMYILICIGLLSAGGGFLATHRGVAQKTRSYPSVTVLMLVGFLITGSILTGIGPETFSSERRSAIFEQPGRDKYHEPWDYSTAAFLADHADLPIGDIRLFGTLLEYERRAYRSLEGIGCYTEPCRYRTVVWFDSYESVWQATGTTTYWTSFPGGKQSLANRRSMIYTTGHSGVFVRTNRVR